MALKESDLQLLSVDCLTGAVEPMCVLDPDNECCMDVPREEISFKDGCISKKTIDSIPKLPGNSTAKYADVEQ